MGQADEITRTTEQCPNAEDELLNQASKVALPELREAARRKRQEAMDPEELHARQRRARSFRHWIDELGLTRISGALPPEVGVPFTNRLDVETRRLRKQAGRWNESEEWEATAADAFAAMIDPSTSPGGSTRRPTAADVVLVCDLAAFRRGRAEAGEVCHIVGGGRVPVRVVREWLEQDAFLKAVLHDGVKIDTVKHFGRHIPAELRTALGLGAPPFFDGAVCACGCAGRYGLQHDHIDPVANDGPTSFDNLQPLTGNHHRIKTSQDRAAGLLTSKYRRTKRRGAPKRNPNPRRETTGERGPPDP
jgi:hypothetical protein